MESLIRPFKLSHGSTEEKPSIILDLNSLLLVTLPEVPIQGPRLSQPTDTVFVHAHAILLELL